MERLFWGAALSFVVVLLLAPRMIPLLHRLKFGQVVREDGPSRHQAKTGTPTMGGVLILVAAAIAVLATTELSRTTWLLLATTLAFGLLGFWDDYIKVVLKRNLGLKARQKLLGQILISGVFAVVASAVLQRGTGIWVPWIDVTADVGVLFYLLVFLVLVGTTNGLT